jgi:hypothetical protein
MNDVVPRRRQSAPSGAWTPPGDLLDLLAEVLADATPDAATPAGDAAGPSCPSAGGQEATR